MLAVKQRGALEASGKPSFAREVTIAAKVGSMITAGITTAVHTKAICIYFIIHINGLLYLYELLLQGMYQAICKHRRISARSAPQN